ncbi:No apical meristem (NAM) protein [Corchorus olitorius]|uniref:No apical meristem (NAM) protein n=1 Tax=Corchorus olitorius TaxID=93759 RepID=A0A1R3IIF6_9ROSI|nr:No apical meristem (NAM) protein [Corchorus olitorius]
MKYIKGFRFHPTDEEAIELLYDKSVVGRDLTVQVNDSVVHVITQLKDICEFEPWELPGLSELASGENVWFFFCSPRFKYRKSIRKNRVTKKGYWTPTGKPRNIVTTYDGKRITGRRQTLVFYKDRVSNKKKKENKTSWVIHELELTLNLPNIKSITLCKLKKKLGKIDVSRGEEGHSSQSSPNSNVKNHSANSSIAEGQLNCSEVLTESEAINENSGIQTQFTTNEQDDDEFVSSLLVNNDEMINQSYLVVENEDSKIPPKFPKNHEDFGELLINQKPKGTSGCVGTQDQAYTTTEHDNLSWSSIFNANNQIYSKEGSNQHNIFAENKDSTLFLDFIPMEHLGLDEFLRNGIFMAELFTVPEAVENPDGVEHDKSSTNEHDDKFRNSIFTTDEVEAPKVFRSKEQNFATKTEAFHFPSMSTMESLYNLCPMESTKKRPCIESEGLGNETNSFQ